MIDTVKIVDIEHREGAVVREYVLATVSAGRRRPEIFRLIELFKANLVEVSARSITIDLVGPPRRVDRFLDLLRPYGLRDFARSGYIAVRQHDRKETHHVRSNVLR